MGPGDVIVRRYTLVVTCHSLSKGGNHSYVIRYTFGCVTGTYAYAQVVAGAVAAAGRVIEQTTR